MGQSVAVVIPFKSTFKTGGPDFIDFCFCALQRANDDESTVRSIIRELPPKECRESARKREREIESTSRSCCCCVYFHTAVLNAGWLAGTLLIIMLSKWWLSCPSSLLSCATNCQNAVQEYFFAKLFIERTVLFEASPSNKVT